MDIGYWEVRVLPQHAVSIIGAGEAVLVGGEA